MNENRGFWRGKRLDNGEWVDGFLVKMWGAIHLQNRENENLMVQVDSETLSECTGLSDKNKNLIFEGDIVHAVYKIGYGGIKDTDFGNGVVEYHGNYYSGARWEMNIIGEAGCRVFSASIECEVIGNIYDNPELLEGGENNA